MTWTAYNLYGPAQPTSTGAVTLYTTTGKAVIKEVIIANNTTGVGTIKLGIGGVASANLFVPEIALVGKSTSQSVDNLTILALATVVSSGNTIQAQNGSSSFLLTLTVSAEENT